MTAIAGIKEHMQVLASDGTMIGVVDRMEGENRIKLTKHDSFDGRHHFIDVSLVDHVDEHVHLSQPADQVMHSWDSEEDLELEQDDAGMSEIEQSTEQKEKEWMERRR